MTANTKEEAPSTVTGFTIKVEANSAVSENEFVAFEEVLLESRESGDLNNDDEEEEGEDSEFDSERDEIESLSDMDLDRIHGQFVQDDSELLNNVQGKQSYTLRLSHLLRQIRTRRVHETRSSKVQANVERYWPRGIHPQND